MRAGWGLVALGCAALATACVDGTTPDCSTPASGCYPGDAAPASDGQTDAADATPFADASDAASAAD